MRTNRRSAAGKARAAVGRRAVRTHAHRKLAKKQDKASFVDYYDLLSVPSTASDKDIKAAYRELQKLCHPDVCGEDGHEMCIILNDAYDVLSEKKSRRNYDAARVVALQDEEEGYTGLTKSKWCSKDEEEDRAVFVDETACIGCRQCIYHAAATFRMEEENGRAYCFAQWLNDEDSIQTAIDGCPVSCIHWVQREELPVLEHVMTKLERVDVGIMMTSGGAQPADPFAAAETFVRKRADRLRKRKLEIELDNARRRNKAYYQTAATAGAAAARKQDAVAKVRERARAAANGELGPDGRPKAVIALLPPPPAEQVPA